MSNKNFGEPWEGKIERIRENLREGRYALRDGIFPIVKELIQNAEDAPAERLLVAWEPGLPHAEHPLLRGPGLLAINDGKFDSANGRAIREMGLSSKAADTSTIGKFGLGMKSVFHLAEVFFFIAVDGQGHQIDADIRSPWSTDDGGLHADWDDFSAADQAAITARVQSLFGEGPWFCLWLPLRTSTNCGNVDPIESNYPGDQHPSKLIGPKQYELAATIVPLLARLKLVQFRIPAAGGFTNHDIRVADHSTRRAVLSSLRPAGDIPPTKFAGQIASTGGTADALLIYSGAEHHLNDSQLNVLERDENKKWPKRFATDRSTGQSQQVPEKARQHAAVCFTAAHRPQTSGQLRIHWAVFLPLGLPETIALATGWDIDLALHGWFFPNSGRTEVEGLRQDAPAPDTIHDSATVRLAWNHRLARCGTLPLLPAACSDIAIRCDWKESTRVAVTHAIQHSELFARFREDVCQRDAFVRRLNKSGTFEWCVVPAGLPVVSLPSTPDESLAATVLPALRRFAEAQAVVLQGFPRLTALSAEQRWPVEVVRALLATVPAADLMRSRLPREFFFQFLDTATAQPASSLFADELVTLARSALISLRNTDSNDARLAAQQFLSHIPSQRCIRLSLEIEDDQSADLFLTLCNSTESVVWVPASVAQHSCEGGLQAAEALKVLKALSQWTKRKLTPQQVERIAVVGAQVIRATRELASLVADAGDLKLFSATNCRERQEVRLTWADLIDHHRRCTLFVKPSPMAFQLQDSLANDDIVLISKELAEAVFGSHDNAPAQCREGQMLDALTATDKPALSAPGQRRKLFETMRKFTEGRREADFCNGVRYLLHAKPAHFSAKEPLLVQGDGANDVWWRIAKLSLSTLDQQWRIVDPVFSVLMSAEDRREFTIEVIGPDVACRLADGIPTEAFAGLRPSDTDYGDLLRHIADDELLRRLPIHRAADNSFVSLTSQTFWEGKWSLPSELQQAASILRRSTDELTWKRQQQLIPTLDARAVIDVVLNAPHPDRHWQLIMDCLIEAHPLPKATLDRLKATIWAPLPSATAVKPEDILHLPRLSDDVARLVAQFPGVFVDANALHPDLCAHPAFPILLTHVVPAQSDALGMLGILLLEDELNAVGIADIAFDDWLAAFQSDDGVLFPQIALLRAVKDKLPNAAESTFGVLKKAISESRTRQLLAFLRAAHIKDRSSGRRKTIVRVFSLYLRQLMTVTGYEAGVQDTELPTSDGHWKSPHELCLTNDGVAAGFVIDRQVEAEIADLLPVVLQTEALAASDNLPGGTLSIREPDWNVPAATERLRAYFDRWRDLLPNEQIGGFLALLGDDPAVRLLAEEFLGRNRTLDETRDKFGLLAMQCGRDPSGNPIMEDAQTMIRKQRVVVEIAAEPLIHVLNLLGDEITVPRNERPMTLFVGFGNRNSPFPHRIDQGLRLRCFRLNAIDPTEFTEIELSRLLRDSAAKFIAEAYNNRESQTRFATTWDELAASDQLDIRITQSRIIESGFLILDLYGLRSDPDLARVLDRWDAAVKLKHERETQSPNAQRHLARDPDREMQDARQELRRLFEQPPTTPTQANILAAVQHRIADHNQYKLSSIPFELFQNADDAYAELHHYFSGPPLAHSRREPAFDLLSQPSRLVFVHFGRRINQYPIDADRAAHGFDNDLWKMSVLSLSNKGQNPDEAAVPVTGKFGLGFKSVFLACDRPRLLSGRLAFEFIGGIYPRRLIGEERRSLDDLRDQFANRDPQATLVVLELAEGIDGTKVTSRFRELAHLLVVFARQIRRSVCGSDGAEVTWEPTEILGVPGWSSGEIKPVPSEDRKSEPQRVLQFRSDAGQILFALGSRGIESFSPEVPSIWVTAPTEEALQLGFLVNGPFALDPGRAQLARDPAQNHAAAQRLGQDFGKHLADLFAAFQDSSQRIEIRHTLRLAADVQAFDLWSSLWERLVFAVSERATNDQPADQLIRDILWSSLDSGVASFYSHHAAIPVRLPGKRFEGQLVSLASVRFAIRGVLAQRDRRPSFDGHALACVCTWPAFQERVGNGMLISHERVVRPLERLCPSLVQHITAITLVDIVRWESPHQMIDPAKAERFGELLTREFLAQIPDQTETNRIRDFLDTTEFLAADGLYHPARELLIGRLPFADGGWSSDECFRTSFAPASKVVNEQYGQMGLRFFIACREKLSAAPQDMAGWVRAAIDHATRKAALVYLADGDAGRAVQTELKRQCLEGTWLADLASLPCFKELSTPQKHHLAELLARDEAADLLQQLLAGAQPPPHLNPRTVLQAIHDWWTANGPQATRDYEARVYPNGGLQFLDQETAEHARQRRKDWVTLFLLGLTHTMGRTVAEQHRSFLRRCEQDGWLDMIASSERQPGVWMDWIDSFLDGQLDDSRFLQWMKQFVGIYQVSRHLDDYIEVFLAAQRFGQPFALTQLTNTRASAAFQAGGVEAPPLSRVLGMGQCFVLRELVRHQVLSNPHVHPHCFVPVARVRRMLVDLGCDDLLANQQPWEWSRAIFAFLRQYLGDQATFGGAFDIPLQVVADDANLQMQFFAAPIETDDEESALWFDDDNPLQSEDT